jgi:predicted outer membrane repeat protein
VIGSGTPASCTPAAVVAAVAAGGVITFSCGRSPVTITMTATATVASTSHQVVLDGGGKVTLSGAGTTQILSMNAGWQQQWPQLVVQNLTFTDAYSGTQQTTGSSVYGGGAIFDEGGQLKVVDSAFTGNSCFATGPDLGGGAVRAVGMYTGSPVYITGDTFTGNSCSNGGALSGLFAQFDVINSLMTGNKAIGWGANPAAAGTPGGGSGGAIYTDGAACDLNVTGTVMRGNTAREGGGGISAASSRTLPASSIPSTARTPRPSWSAPRSGNAPGLRVQGTRYIVSATGTSGLSGRATWPAGPGRAR